MRVVIHQPSYLPWLGFFDRVAQSDVYVVLDTVQYDKHGWRNRNRIKTPAGPQWLTVPILTRHRPGLSVGDAMIDPHVPWSRKHVNALRANYARAPYGARYLDPLAELLHRPWQRLLEVTTALDEFLFRALGMHPRRVPASTLGDLTASSASDRLAVICRKLGATEYLSPDAAKDYLDPEPFQRVGVAVRFHGYRHPVYPQLHGPFTPSLSIVDLLMNCGDQSFAILTHRSAPVSVAP